MLLKPLDLFVLVWLATRPDRRWKGTVRDLAAVLGVVPSQVQYALTRAARCHLFAREERRVLVPNLLEFLEHGLRYALPVEPGPIEQGVPTAHSAPVMQAALASAGDPALSRLVWPDLTGPVTGQSLTPLHPAVPALAQVDGELYAAMALVDSLRVGGARERSVAAGSNGPANPIFRVVRRPGTVRAGGGRWTRWRLSNRTCLASRVDVIPGPSRRRARRSQRRTAAG